MICVGRFPPTVEGIHRDMTMLKETGLKLPNRHFELCAAISGHRRKLKV